MGLRSVGHNRKTEHAQALMFWGVVTRIDAYIYIFFLQYKCGIMRISGKNWSVPLPEMTHRPLLEV